MRRTATQGRMPLKSKIKAPSEHQRQLALPKRSESARSKARVQSRYMNGVSTKAQQGVIRKTNQGSRVRISPLPSPVKQSEGSRSPHKNVRSRYLTGGIKSPQNVLLLEKQCRPKSVLNEKRLVLPKALRPVRRAQNGERQETDA